jgi:hypothetical protein
LFGIEKTKVSVEVTTIVIEADKYFDSQNNNSYGSNYN